MPNCTTGFVAFKIFKVYSSVMSSRIYAHMHIYGHISSTQEVAQLTPWPGIPHSQTQKRTTEVQAAVYARKIRIWIWWLSFWVTHYYQNPVVFPLLGPPPELQRSVRVACPCKRKRLVRECPLPTPRSASSAFVRQADGPCPIIISNHYAASLSTHSAHHLM